ncbi:MAG: transcriptional regulator [Rhodospirillales bacterium]|jgi:prophage regulatory protein|nr:transcriptional regulator [Rhodospirillales bacterium]
MLHSSQFTTPDYLPTRIKQFDALPSSALMNVREISLLSGKSTATLWRDVKNKRLAAPIKLGPNSTRWRVSDVRRFLEGGE